MEVGDSTYLGSTSAELADLVAQDGGFDFTSLPVERVRELYEAGRWWEREEGGAPGLDKLRGQVLGGEVDYFMYRRGPFVSRQYACFVDLVGGLLVRHFQTDCGEGGLSRAPRELFTQKNVAGAVDWVRLDLREQLAWKVSQEEWSSYYRLEGWDGCAIVCGDRLWDWDVMSRYGLEAEVLDVRMMRGLRGSPGLLDKFGRDLFELVKLSGDPRSNPLRLFPSMLVPERWSDCYRDGRLATSLLVATPKLLAHLEGVR